jgi:murein DD-endopeptidase MepM/ murein hydrolase activator NlpD
MYALVPISYYETPKDKRVEVLYAQKGVKKSEKLFLHVEDANYEKEEIQVQKSKVNPKSKKVKKRTQKEYANAMKIYATYSEKNYITSKFIPPMDSKITSAFGKARVYNGSLNGYHSGTDYRAKIGTPIKASNDGVVVLVKDRFYAGGTVILDHGHGIYTCYYHMSKFKVKMGQFVKKAEIIGLSGDSGRVTGPHLHFSARVGGEQVDPLQLIELLNKKLF